MNLVHFQPHAIERFIERHMPGVTMVVAHNTLRDAVPSARRLRERTRSGEECWILPEYEAVMVIRRDGRDGHRVSCLTILPKGAHQGYVHERRVARPVVADPTHTALSAAVRYVAANANRGDERALRVVEEIQRIAPWAFTGIELTRVESENETAPARDSDAAGTGIARLSNTNSDGGRS